MTRSTKWLGSGVAVGLLFLGCSGKVLEVAGAGGAGVTGVVAGTGGAGGAGGAGGTSSTVPAGPALPLWSSTCQPGADALLGTWQGYVEGATPAVDLTLTIQGTLDGGPCGRLVYGHGGPPPPPTDPNVGYPPGLEEGSGGSPGESAWQEQGFAYQLLAGSIEGKRVQFQISNMELWKRWCELQTPVADTVNQGQYNCLPNASAKWDNPDGQCILELPSGDQEVNCGKLGLCTGNYVCVCNEKSCTASMNETVGFDLRFDAAEATGTMMPGQIVHFSHAE
jgi:hypothetical protein